MIAFGRLEAFGKMTESVIYNRLGVAAWASPAVRVQFRQLEWIKGALVDKAIPGYLASLVQSYLSEKTLSYGPQRARIQAGVPQGSVLSRLLWYVMSNGVLLALRMT